MHERCVLVFPSAVAAYVIENARGNALLTGRTVPRGVRQVSLRFFHEPIMAQASKLAD
jgi:hypothetical protein